MEGIREVAAETYGRYSVSINTYLTFSEWKWKHRVLFEQYPEEFDLNYVYKDIALATHLLGLPVPLHVLPESSRPNEKRWTLMDRVIYRVICFEDWPRTYGSVYRQYEKLNVPHTLSNYALALAPVLKSFDVVPDKQLALQR